MGCCIAVALVIALVRGAWFRVFPARRPPDAGFAPPAWRAAPGLGDVASGPVRTREPVPPTGSRLSMALGAAAVTTALYAGITALLWSTGLAHQLTDDGLTRPLRDVLVAGFGITAVVTAAVLYRGPVPQPAGRGAVLTGAGLTWTGLGLLDMHVFGVLHLDHGAVAAASVFHGVGLLALGAGAGLLLGRPGGAPNDRGISGGRERRARAVAAHAEHAAGPGPGPDGAGRRRPIR